MNKTPPFENADGIEYNGIYGSVRHNYLGLRVYCLAEMYVKVH